MTKKKVLIVEDEALIALQLSNDMDRSGYCVLGPVSSGEEAIEIAKTESLDLILMDIRLMGAIDGIDALREILQISKPRIVLISGYSDEKMILRAMELKPLGFLKKPVSINDIKELLGE
jgi:YesN/AraC family two-component response regulator